MADGVDRRHLAIRQLSTAIPSMQAIVVQSFIAAPAPVVWAALRERTDILFDGLPAEAWPEGEEQPPYHLTAPWPFTASPKPTIAAVNGVAVGAGVEFATQCDFRVAAESARFGWVFVHRGLVPDQGVASWLLERIVGLQNAAYLLLSGTMIDAARAKDLGFVLDVVPDAELMERSLALAAEVSRGGPMAMAETKRLLYRGSGSDVRSHMERHIQAIERVFASDDFREGVRAFLDRRPPDWTGH